MKNPATLLLTLALGGCCLLEGPFGFGGSLSYLPGDEGVFGLGILGLLGCEESSGSVRFGGDFFFPESGSSYGAYAVGMYSFATPGSVRPYVLGGPIWSYSDPSSDYDPGRFEGRFGGLQDFSDSRSEFGARLGGGARYGGSGPVTPYAEVAYEVLGGDSNELRLNVGASVRVGRSRGAASGGPDC